MSLQWKESEYRIILSIPGVWLEGWKQSLFFPKQLSGSLVGAKLVLVTYVVALIWQTPLLHFCIDRAVSSYSLCVSLSLSLKQKLHFWAQLFTSG